MSFVQRAVHSGVALMRLSVTHHLRLYCWCRVGGGGSGAVEQQQWCYQCNNTWRPSLQRLMCTASTGDKGAHCLCAQCATVASHTPSPVTMSLINGSGSDDAAQADAV
eukprot:364423-Chlamydomonas_euryale.AAC.4